MKTEEIIKRFAASGIECRSDGALVDAGTCWNSVTPMVYDMSGFTKAYMIGEEGKDVVCVQGPVRVFIPLFENPTMEHVDALIEATKDEKVLDAVISVRTDEIMGMCVFV